MSNEIKNDNSSIDINVPKSKPNRRRKRIILESRIAAINVMLVAGILLTMCENRTTLCKVLTEEVTGSFQGQIRIFENRIPATVKVGESIYYSMPIALYSKNASAGIAYRKFAKELIAYEG